MKEKTLRLQAIREIVEKREIGNQEELAEALKELGYSPTQGTLSRDLKQLKIVKTINLEGRYVYVLPDSLFFRQLRKETYVAVDSHHSGFISIEFSGNMALIKTQPSHASSLAYYIDKQVFPEIIGTIAGDDTIMILIREGVLRHAVLNRLRIVIPSIQKMGTI